MSTFDPATQNLAVTDLSQPAAPPDTKSMDAQLQRMQGIESAWTLPKLPDDVKLDLLAHQGLPDAGAVGNFLYGLQDDMHQAVKAVGDFVAPAAAAAPAQTTQTLGGGTAPVPELGPQFQPKSDLVNQLRYVWSGISQTDEPTVVSKRAVENLKVRAVSRGLLPANTPIDGSWDPQMHAVANDLAYQDVSANILGERPGAARTSTVLDLVDHWLNPVNLASTATALGFLPNVKAIQANFDDFGKSHNPFDLVKAAANIAFPVLNDVLLFTGTSEVVAMGRAAQIANEARMGLEGAEAANDLFRGAKALTLAERLNPFTPFSARVGGALGDVERFSAPSWTAQRLQPGLGAGGEEAARSGLLGRTGDVLGSWRQATGSLVARKAVQQAMRAGVAGQIETSLYPELSGIGFTGVGVQAERADMFGHAVQYHPVFGPIANALSLPLMPANIVEPGTFARPLKALGTRLTEAVSSVSNNTLLMNAMHESLHSHLAAVAPEEATKYMDLARQHGVKTAFSAVVANGDDAKLGEILTFVTAQAAAVSWADANVKLLEIDRLANPGQWNEAFHTYVNHYTNLMRPIEQVDLDTLDGVQQVARQRSNAEWPIISPNDSQTVIRHARDDKYNGVVRALLHDDPDMRAQAGEWIQSGIDHHNAVRQDVLNQLLNGLDPGFLSSYLDGMWSRIGVDNFEAMAGVGMRLQELHALDQLKYVSAKEPSWRPSSWAEHVPAVIDPADYGKTKALTAFGGNPDPERQHFTGMLFSEPDRQEAAALIGYVKTLNQRLRTLRADESGLDASWPTYGAPLVAHLAGDNPAENAGVQALASIRPGDLKNTVQELFPTGGIPSKAALRDYTDTLRWVARQGGDPAAAIDHIKQQLDGLASSPLWNKFRIDASATFPDRLKALEAQLPYIAGRVQVPPEIEQYLAARGMKPVAGVDFMFPHDMTDLNGPFGELRKAHLRRISLGRFLSNQDDNISFLRRISLERNMASSLGTTDIQPLVGAGEGSLPFSVGSEDQRHIIDRLFEKQQQIRAASTLQEQQLSGHKLGSLGAAVTNLSEPQSMYDFDVKQLTDIFGDTYGPAFPKILKKALSDSKHLGWQYEGLSAIETRLRANSWLKSYLKVFGKAEASEGLGEWNGVKRAGVGVLSGAMALAAGANPQTALAAGAIGGALGGGGLKQRAIGAGAAGVAGTVLGGGLAGGLTAAAAAGLNPASIRNPFNLKLATGIASGAVGAQTAQSAGMDRDQSALVGLGAGLAAVGGLKAAAPNLLGRFASAKAVGLDAFSSNGWAEYSKLGEGLAHLRDAMRFSLNPFFDLRRYVKSAVRGATADLPEGVTVPVLHHLTGTAEEQAAKITRFREATHPWFDSEKIDEMSRFSSDKGILGFSPTRDMAGMFTHLVEQGVPDAHAADLVRKTLTYGGRTGLEKSVNFVFFPFSFEKKVLGQLARFAGDDLGRTVVIHDAVKAYELLNDRYDLSQELQDHVPLMEELSKLNMFTNGISPGELGGVNRPLLEGLMASPVGGAIAPALNMFLPQGLHIDAGTDTDQLTNMMRRLVPAYRDIEQLIQNTAQQGHVVFSSSHMTDRAEVSTAYGKWDTFKGEVSKFATQNGTTYDTLMRSDKYLPIRQYIERYRADLDRQYPAWQDARTRASANAAAAQMDLADVIAQPQTKAEGELGEFNTVVKSLESAIQTQTGTSFRTNPDAMPPEFYDAIRNLAVAYARQGNGFESLYKRYFEAQFGPIEEPVG